MGEPIGGRGETTSPTRGPQTVKRVDQGRAQGDPTPPTGMGCTRTLPCGRDMSRSMEHLARPCQACRGDVTWNRDGRPVNTTWYHICREGSFVNVPYAHHGCRLAFGIRLEPLWTIVSKPNSLTNITTKIPIWAPLVLYHLFPRCSIFLFCVFYLLDLFFFYYSSLPSFRAFPFLFLSFVCAEKTKGQDRFFCGWSAFSFSFSARENLFNLKRTADPDGRNRRWWSLAEK